MRLRIVAEARESGALGGSGERGADRAEQVGPVQPHRLEPFAGTAKVGEHRRQVGERGVNQPEHTREHRRHRGERRDGECGGEEAEHPLGADVAGDRFDRDVGGGEHEARRGTEREQQVTP